MSCGKLNQEDVAQLVACDFDPEYTCNGSSLLYQAVVNRQPFMVHALLEAGADPNRDLGMRMKPFLISLACRDLESLKIQLAFKADPDMRNQDRETPLHFAAFRNDLELTCLLLEAGANPVLQNHDGRTASDLARKSNFMPLADMLDAWQEKMQEEIDLEKRRDFQRRVFSDNMSRYDRFIPSVRRPGP